MRTEGQWRGGGGWHLGDELANLIMAVVHGHDLPQQAPLCGPCAHRPKVHHLEQHKTFQIRLPMHQAAFLHDKLGMPQTWAFCSASTSTLCSLMHKQTIATHHSVGSSPKSPPPEHSPTGSEAGHISHHAHAIVIGLADEDAFLCASVAASAFGSWRHRLCLMH